MPNEDVVVKVWIKEPVVLQCQMEDNLAWLQSSWAENINAMNRRIVTLSPQKLGCPFSWEWGNNSWKFIYNLLISNKGIYFYSKSDNSL